MTILGIMAAISLSFSGTLPVAPVYANQTSFAISLPANPSTGYQWTLLSYNKKYLKFLKKEYKPGSKKLIGTPGSMMFYFSCVATTQRPQETLVSLVYHRPWEKRQKNDETVVHVVFLNTEKGGRPL